MNKSISIFAVTISLAAGSFWATSAHASNYGAIAYSPSTGASGRAWDYPNRGAAERAALNNCYQHASDCKVFWFRNACGALASGRNGGWGSAWANTRRGAENGAIQNCRQFTRNCQVRVWQCTTR